MTYSIRVTKHFYGPKAVKSYLTNPDTDKRVEFQSHESAQAMCDELDGEVYHTANNESGRPDYKVVRL